VLLPDQVTITSGAMPGISGHPTAHIIAPIALYRVPRRGDLHLVAYHSTQAHPLLHLHLPIVPALSVHLRSVHPIHPCRLIPSSHTTSNSNLPQTETNPPSICSQSSLLPVCLLCIPKTDHYCQLHHGRVGTPFHLCYLVPANSVVQNISSRNALPAGQHHQRSPAIAIVAKSSSTLYPLHPLLADQIPQVHHFRRHTRQYKSYFAFTSFRAGENHHVLDGCGPSTWKTGYEIYMIVGTLIHRMNCMTTSSAGGG
jgi:hypothetical protein